MIVCVRTVQYWEPSRGGTVEEKLIEMTTAPRIMARPYEYVQQNAEHQLWESFWRWLVL
jgi:hypothetical protein